MNDWVEVGRALVLALCGGGIFACVYLAWEDDALRSWLVRFFGLSTQGPSSGTRGTTIPTSTALVVHSGSTGQALVASRQAIATTPFPTVGSQPDVFRNHQHDVAFVQRQTERRDAYEEQVLRQRMELAAVMHLDALAAARLAIDTRARERCDEAVMRALARRNAFIDAQRRRAEVSEDHTRRRQHSIEDELRARVESLEVHVLRRPEVLAHVRFDHEVGEQRRAVQRLTWQTDAEDRVRARSDAADERLRAREEREQAAKAAERKERAAARDAARARRHAEAAAAAKLRDDARRRREERARVRAAEKAHARQARANRQAAKQEAERRASAAVAAARADEGARARQAASDASDQELAEDQRAARQRRREAAAIAHDIAMAKQRAKQRAQLQAVPTEPPPPDPALAALKQDCARVALDVSTGTVLLGEQNCYHGFAAIKFHEFLRTMSPPDAQAATARVLFARRWQQPPLTLEEARAFAAQYERTTEAKNEQAALAAAQKVLAHFNVGTEDRYGHETPISRRQP